MLLAGKLNCVSFQGVFLFSGLIGKPWFFSAPKNYRKQPIDRWQTFGEIHNFRKTHMAGTNYRKKNLGMQWKG